MLCILKCFNPCYVQMQCWCCSVIKLTQIICHCLCHQVKWSASEVSCSKRSSLVATWVLLPSDLRMHYSIVSSWRDCLHLIVTKVWLTLYTICCSCVDLFSMPSFITGFLRTCYTKVHRLLLRVRKTTKSVIRYGYLFLVDDRTCCLWLSCLHYTVVALLLRLVGLQNPLAAL